MRDPGRARSWPCATRDSPVGPAAPSPAASPGRHREPDAYRRLSYTWHTFTPEWAAAYGLSEEYLAKVAAERRSKVTFDIEPAGEMVKLTVIHDGFDPGSTVLQDISAGWPRVLSDLKTLLEKTPSPVG